MELIHSIWDNDNFYVWVETLDTLFGRRSNFTKEYPVANTTSYPNARNINQILKILQIAGLEEIANTNVTASSVALNSSENPLVVDALCIPPLETLDLLLDQLEKKSDYFSLSDSTLFWMKIAKFVLEIVAVEKFIPYIYEENKTAIETTFLGKWKVLLDSEDEALLVHLTQEFKEKRIDETLFIIFFFGFLEFISSSLSN